MSYPHSLSSLTPREAIIDAAYRAIISFDRNDLSIFNSAFTENSIVEINGPKKIVLSGLSTIRTEILGRIGAMDSTHMMSNIRVDVKEGADTAFLTAYVLAQHCAPGKGKEPNSPKYLVGAEYWIDLVRDDVDGLWKIKKWVLDAIWTEGDSSVMASTGFTSLVSSD